MVCQVKIKIAFLYNECMTPEQEDAILIRTLRERKAASQRLTYLKVEIEYLSERLGFLANYLAANPHHVKFEDDEGQRIYQEAPRRERTSGLTFKTSEIDGKNIAALVREYRETSEKFSKLEETVKTLGF
jgi:hypothetical protein